MQDLIPFEQVLEKELRDPEVRAEWERLAPARALANRLVGYRADHGLSQRALGKLLGMSLSEVTRLESAEEVPSQETVARLTTMLQDA